MMGTFYQYLCRLSFALLTILGWYHGQLQQYLSVGDESICFTTDIRAKNDDSSEKSLLYFKERKQDYVYDISPPTYSKICADLSESDRENDDQFETSSTQDLAIFNANFWGLISGFITTFHDKQNAVSLAHSGHSIFEYDDLYIQYRVIRL